MVWLLGTARDGWDGSVAAAARYAWRLYGVDFIPLQRTGISPSFNIYLNIFLGIYLYLIIKQKGFPSSVYLCPRFSFKLRICHRQVKEKRFTVSTKKYITDAVDYSLDGYDVPSSSIPCYSVLAAPPVDESP
jgi:hypothetical protein